MVHQTQLFFLYEKYAELSMSIWEHEMSQTKYALSATEMHLQSTSLTVMLYACNYRRVDL